ncbi:MAG: creatininase family protein [Lachnospiraceae bacterium]|jgi:creatinine amidohydrolase|nr:creatininase family protein [Lachnospiraceae bacterium]
MLWENLNAREFGDWVDKSEGVCVLPMGVLEKHGDHLPLGTDMFIVTEVAKAAAALSPVVVFPYYYMGQISEARHVKGTIAPSHRLIMDALLEMCDEIHRNGFKKILILNGHGGNMHFLPFFAQMYPGLKREYTVYTKFVASLKTEQYQEIAARSGVEEMGDHAGFSETALIMHLRPNLVTMDNVVLEESRSLERLSEISEAGLYTGFHWYANYPHHFAGDPSKAAAEYGKIMFEMMCENVAEMIRVIKADDVSLPMIAEYTKLAF